MKVLHVIPSVSERSGGPAQAIFPMCRALIARGHEITIATTRHGLPDLKGNGKAPQLCQGTSTYFFPVQWGNRFKYSRPLKTWLDENVCSFDVVHIHAVFNHSSIAASRSCRKHVVPYIVRPLGTLDPWSMQQKRFRKTLFWTLGGKQMLDSAGAIHYTAQAEFDRVRESLGLTHGVVVPLGIENGSKSISDVVLGAPASPPDRVTYTHFDSNGQPGTPELPTGRGPYVLFLSRLHPKKGLDVLIAAFVALQKDKRFSEWRLVIAGDGDSRYVRSLKRLANENASGESIDFIGWMRGHQKREVLRNASLLVLPSRQENFGLCVLEALSEGVPVVVSRGVNLAKDIADAGAGWVSDVDVSGLESTLSKAMVDERQRVTRGLAARVFSQNFTWESIAEKLENIYLSVIKSGG